MLLGPKYVTAFLLFPHVVLSLAVALDAEGYFRFSPEHEQWVELENGVSSVIPVAFN